MGLVSLETFVQRAEKARKRPSGLAYRFYRRFNVLTELPEWHREPVRLKDVVIPAPKDEFKGYEAALEYEIERLRHDRVQYEAETKQLLAKIDQLDEQAAPMTNEEHALNWYRQQMPWVLSKELQ